MRYDNIAFTGVRSPISQKTNKKKKITIGSIYDELFSTVVLFVKFYLVYITLNFIYPDLF